MKYLVILMAVLALSGCKDEITKLTSKTSTISCSDEVGLSVVKDLMTQNLQKSIQQDLENFGNTSVFYVSDTGGG